MTLHTNVLRRRSGEVLQSAVYNPKKLVLIHTGVSLGATFLMVLACSLLSRMIADSGGLSGMEMRSILTTVQVLLELAVMVLLPFWEIGLLRAAVNWARGESAEPPVLREGFRRAGAVLVQKLLYTAVFLIPATAISYVSITVFLLSPFASAAKELLAPLMEASMEGIAVEGMLTPELSQAFMQAIIPFVVLFGVLFVVVAIPLFYWFRFSEFSLMAGNGPVRAMVESVVITRKHVWQIVKLDLSYWWFYLLQGLCLGISNGDSLLSGLGVTLPMSEDAACLLFYALGILCQLVLLWQFQAKRITTYALAYDALGRESAR